MSLFNFLFIFQHKLKQGRGKIKMAISYKEMMKNKGLDSFFDSEGVVKAVKEDEE